MSLLPLGCARCHEPLDESEAVQTEKGFMHWNCEQATHTVRTVAAKPMSSDELQAVAVYFCDLFERYSVNTPIDRLDPAYRVGRSDLTAQYPKLSLLDWQDLQPLINLEMKRRGLSFKRKRVK